MEPADILATLAFTVGTGMPQLVLWWLQARA